jgi:hypothetical protein
MKAIAIAISLSAVLCCASAQSLRSQIDASNKAIHGYMLARDAKGFTKYMKSGVTSDFKYVEAGHTQNFDQMCAGMAAGFAQMKKLTRADSKILSLREQGNKATSTMTHNMSGVTMGPDKKAHTMTFIGTSEDTYVKQGGKWKMSKMSWKNQSMMVDGKPMNGMMETPKGK